jgi:hypothetical protein
MSARDDSFDVALETAATATAGLRPAVEGLREIADLRAMIPLASEIACRTLGEVKDAICVETATDHYQRQLEGALQRVDLPGLKANASDAALGGGRR